MNTDRIKEIQEETAYPESVSVQQALLKVWNETEQEQLRIADVRKSLAPHRCPVCNGNGLVPNGFYMQTSGYWSTSDSALETCRSCNGSGIVWG